MGDKNPKKGKKPKKNAVTPTVSLLSSQEPELIIKKKKTL